MISILVVSHGNFAQGIVETGKMFVGEQENIDFLGLNEGDNIEEFSNQIQNKVSELNAEEGVIIFSDLYGASPFKAAIDLISNKSEKDLIKSISGVNLPMYVEAVLNREFSNIEDLYSQCMEAGKESIKELSEELNNM